MSQERDSWISRLRMASSWSVRKGEQGTEGCPQSNPLIGRVGENRSVRREKSREKVRDCVALTTVVCDRSLKMPTNTVAKF